MSEVVPIEKTNEEIQDLDKNMEISKTEEDNTSKSTAINNNTSDDIKERMEKMEEEAAKLRELHSKLNEGNIDNGEEDRRDIDSRSIYIGNVDYGTTPLELQEHFSSAGVVNRVTILINKFTGQPKGFAYLEFADVDGVNKAVATLDGSTFRDRELKVSAKRTNIPGMGINSRGRGRDRGGFRGGFMGRGRGRGRGRGAFGGGNRFTPY